LVVIQGNYGKRIVDNLSSHAPKVWRFYIQEVPSRLPPVIDEPEEFLPETIPQVDLLLSLGENPGVAELIPDLVKLSRAKAAILPCDNPGWLPAGLKNQIKKELSSLQVDSVFPSPFCCLTDKSSNNEYIRAFARFFGKPEITVVCNAGKISKVTIHRGTPCGCTKFIAQKLVGIHVDEAERKAALFHHYYPCLASTKVGVGFKDSLLHYSANITMSIVKKAIEACQK